MATLIERKLAPRRDLIPWISSINQARATATDSPRHVLCPPVAETAILARWLPDGQVSLRIIGPLTHARTKTFAAPRMYIRIAFRGGLARGLFGHSLATLANQILPLEDVWSGARELRDRLEAQDPAAALGVLEEAIALRTRLAPQRNIVTRIMKLLEGDVQNAARSVAGAARDLGISERHLRRLFEEELGMTPKHYARVARLQRVLVAHDQAATSWSRAALDAGFHDQSHLIREFRDLLATTPARLPQLARI